MNQLIMSLIQLPCSQLIESYFAQWKRTLFYGLNGLVMIALNSKMTCRLYFFQSFFSISSSNPFVEHISMRLSRLLILVFLFLLSQHFGIDLMIPSRWTILKSAILKNIDKKKSDRNKSSFSRPANGVINMF